MLGGERTNLLTEHNGMHKAGLFSWSFENIYDFSDASIRELHRKITMGGGQLVNFRIHAPLLMLPVSFIPVNKKDVHDDSVHIKRFMDGLKKRSVFKKQPSLRKKSRRTKSRRTKSRRTKSRRSRPSKRPQSFYPPNVYGRTVVV